MVEGVFDFMVFFIGLRALLKHKKDDDMGKRGKRKKKFQNRQNNKTDWDKESEALELMSKKDKKDKDDKEDKRKPFERVVLPPPREAQEGHV